MLNSALPSIAFSRCKQATQTISKILTCISGFCWGAIARQDPPTLISFRGTVPNSAPPHRCRFTIRTFPGILKRGYPNHFGWEACSATISISHGHAISMLHPRLTQVAAAPPSPPDFPSTI